MTGSHISLFAGVGMTDIDVETAGCTKGWTDPSVPNDTLIPFAGWEDEPMERITTEPRTIPNRAKRIRAAGNGLVPQAAEIMLSHLLGVQVSKNRNPTITQKQERSV